MSGLRSDFTVFCVPLLFFSQLGAIVTVPLSSQMKTFAKDVALYSGVSIGALSVHELGHKGAFSLFGIPSKIEFTGYGGVTIPSVKDIDNARFERALRILSYITSDHDKQWRIYRGIVASAGSLSTVCNGIMLLTALRSRNAENSTLRQAFRYVLKQLANPISNRYFLHSRTGPLAAFQSYVVKMIYMDILYLLQCGAGDGKNLWSDVLGADPKTEMQIASFVMKNVADFYILGKDIPKSLVSGALFVSGVLVSRGPEKVKKDIKDILPK